MRRKTQPVSLAEIQNLQAERAAKDALDAKLHEELSRKATEENYHAESTSCVQHVLESITAAGYDSLYAFVDELLNIQDQQLSAQVSRMLGRHGEAILNSIRARHPNLANTWAVNVSGEILAQEGKRLANYLRPSKGTLVSDVLENFSLERILSEAERIAPTLCQILRLVSTSPKSDGTDDENHLDCSLVCLSYKFYLFI